MAVTAWPRKIIHVDMDAFFAAIEQRDHPEYLGKPVVVGGNPQGRGVVSTASYEARPYGIKSAMPAATAKRLCPQAIFLRPTFEKYQKESRMIMSIMNKYTDLVEPVSLDEAYLDVTKNLLNIDDPVQVASLLKQNIFAVTKLTASAGVAPNLFLAKIASDFNKPDGLTVIRPEDAEEFLRDLPVRKIPGVGPVTERELHHYGFKTCGDVAKKNARFLKEAFGKFGETLYKRVLGMDDREVEPGQERKQYSNEETFAEDTKDLAWLEDRLEDYAQETFLGLSVSGRMGRTIVLKVKYFDFEQITRSQTLDHEPKSWQEIYKVARHLLKLKTQAGKKPIRLLGLGISGLHKKGENKTPMQGDLFEEQF